jgi:hypothetical protein
MLATITIIGLHIAQEAHEYVDAVLRLPRRTIGERMLDEPPAQREPPAQSLKISPFQFCKRQVMRARHGGG